jgi:hypothetical protein
MSNEFLDTQVDRGHNGTLKIYDLLAMTRNNNMHHGKNYVEPRYPHCTGVLTWGSPLETPDVKIFSKTFDTFPVVRDDTVIPYYQEGVVTRYNSIVSNPVQRWVSYPVQRWVSYPVQRLDYRQNCREKSRSWEPNQCTQDHNDSP